METKTKRRITDRRTSSKPGDAFLKRKRHPVKHSKRRKDVTSIRRDRFGFVDISKFKRSKSPIDVAYVQDVNRIFGKKTSIEFLAHLHQVLSKNNNWCDTHTWSGDELPGQVILTLLRDLEQLKPEKTEYQIDERDHTLSLQSYFRFDSCFIDVSRFITQLREHNPPLFELVATVLGKMKVVLKMELWHSEYEVQAIDYLDNCLYDIESMGWDEETEKYIRSELAKWNDHLIPLQDHCVKLGRSTSLPDLRSAVKTYPWPDTFTAKRVYLWFQRAFKLLEHGKSLCWATPYDVDDEADVWPVTPYEAYRFHWCGYPGVSGYGPVHDHVEQLYNHHWGEGGQIELQMSTQLKKGWDIDTQWFDDLDDFLDSSISLWNEPGYRDICNLEPIETERKVIKDYHRTYVKFIPVSFKPYQSTI